MRERERKRERKKGRKKGKEGGKEEQKNRKNKERSKTISFPEAKNIWNKQSIKKCNIIDLMSAKIKSFFHPSRTLWPLTSYLTSSSTSFFAWKIRTVSFCVIKWNNVCEESMLWEVIVPTLTCKAWGRKKMQMENLILNHHRKSSILDACSQN